ncbi:dynamin family protein [Photobacterium sp. SDRW27]|uniref:GTPase family protein n=1 Tax=Photobacterium obscurum TaxID=2829490 RepID=UPI002244D292|nr:dynamin family protein [Photobacterium obscurum]MCW8327831.1 dynamin family protein [Photobacterium obscurum]
MKRTKNSINALTQLSGGVLPLLMTLLVLPVLVLALIGVVSLIQNGYWLMFALLLGLSAAAVLLPYFWLRKNRQQAEVEVGSLADYEVETSGQWSEFDQAVWQQLNCKIDSQLASACEWSQLREHALDLATEVAEQYHPDKSAKELAFTAPEFLLMVEEVSRRYRQFLLDHVPFVEKIRLTTLKQGYEQKDKLGVAKHAYDIYRVFRMMTPAGLVAEARGQLLGRLFDEVSDEVQAKLKRVLLQEVASVAIDLYSGRFTKRDHELDVSKVSLADQQRFVAEIEPLRVAVVGQISAGKSSLINAIAGSMVAEVSVLPSTENVTVHRCDVDGIDWIHLVDLPGIDGKQVTDQLLLEQMVSSDLVFWVMKANQPARQLDVELKRQFDAFYCDEKNRNRKKPLILALVNQIDRLQPIHEWQPPYDLVQPSSAKAKTIKAAQDFNQQQIMPDEILSIAVRDGAENYNIEKIAEFILFNYENGVNVQLNRRRIDTRNLHLTDQFKRMYRLGQKALQTTFLQK